MEINELIEEYLVSPQGRRYSGETIIKYKEVLGQFTVYLAQQGIVADDVIQKTVREFKKSLVDRGLKNISVNDYIGVVKSFYEYLLKKEQRSDNPARKVGNLKEPKQLPTFITEDELIHLMDKMETDPTLTVSDVTMFEVLLGTGIRVSEMCDLDITDLVGGHVPTAVELNRLRKKFPSLEISGNWIPGEIHIRHGKGNKERFVPVQRFTENVIKKYLQIRDKRNFTSPYLFCNLTGGRWNRGNVYKRIRPILDCVESLKNGEKRRGPHTLRHTYASLLIQRNVSIRAIRDLLGHTTIATTQIYTHTNIEALRAVHEKSHPRG